MTSPASTTSPRRRPTSRVSSTDAVLTEMVIACSQARDRHEPAVDTNPDSLFRRQGADDRQGQSFGAPEPARGRVEDGAGRRATELIVFGFHQPACPCVFSPTPKFMVEREPTGLDGSSQAGGL